MERNFIDLLELQSMLREEIESSFPEQLWVRAEIASLQAKANGHCYLDLSQSEEGRIVARARAVIWRSRYAPLRAYFREATGGDPAPGMEVLLRVQVGYSELYGMTLTVEDGTDGVAELVEGVVEPMKVVGLVEFPERGNTSCDSLQPHLLLMQQLLSTFCDSSLECIDSLQLFHT